MKENFTNNTCNFVGAALEKAGWESEQIEQLLNLLTSAHEAAEKEDFDNVEAMFAKGSDYGFALPEPALGG